MTAYWEPGTTIEWVYQGTGKHADKPNVRPMTVVRDDADGLVAWLAPGTPLMKPVLEALPVRDAGARRTSSVDFVLDLWIHPDRTIEWKDEDELEGAVTAGRFTPAEADRIIADGHAAVRDIEAWTSPFSDGWQTWSPPLHWRVPAAPTSHQPALIAEELHS